MESVKVMDLFEEYEIDQIKRAFETSKYIIAGIYLVYGLGIGIIMGLTDSESTIGSGIVGGVGVALIGLYLYHHWVVEKNSYEGWKLFLVAIIHITTFPALFIASGVMYVFLDKLQEERIIEATEELEYMKAELISSNDKLHELRVEQFSKVIRKSKKVRLSDFAELLMTEKTALLSWIYDLPDDYEITINGDYVEFGESIVDQVEEIINLLEKPELDLD